MNSSVTMLFPTPFVSAYDDYMTQGDPRMLAFPLMESPMPTITASVIYIAFVTSIGPRMMSARKAYNLRVPMILYNFAMVLLNGYMFLKFGFHGWFGKYNWKCQPVDYSNSVDARAMVTVGWIFYFSKFVEFADTIFFVLRKKQNQVTALHVIHHATMPFNVWFTIRVAPGGHSSFCSFVNCFIHVIMYLYYALAACGPHMAPYIGWKKYITKLQMAQFIIVTAHCFQLLFRDCDYPRIFMGYIGFYSVLFLLMFSNFYLRSYRSKKVTEARLKSE